MKVAHSLFLGFLLLEASSTLADVFPICTEGGGQGQPHICFNGEQFLVIWSDGRLGQPGIYGARITQNGDVLDPNGFLICDIVNFYDIHPDITWGDGKYLLVWESRMTSDSLVLTHIRGLFLDPEGQPMDSSFIIASATSWTNWYEGWHVTYPSVVHADTCFLVTHKRRHWTDYGGFGDFSEKINVNLVTLSGAEPLYTINPEFYGTQREIPCYTFQSDEGEIHLYFYEVEYVSWVSSLSWVIFDENLDTLPRIHLTDTSQIDMGDFAVSSLNQVYLLADERGNRIHLKWFFFIGPGPAVDTICYDYNSVSNPDLLTSITTEDSFHLIWTMNSDLYFASTQFLSYPSEPQVLLSAEGDQKGVDIIYGPFDGGRFFLSWRDNRHGDYDIYGAITDQFPVGIEEKSEGQRPGSISIAPTVFTDELRLTLPRDGPWGFRLYDMSGAMVLEKEELPISFTLNTRSLPAGCYFAVLRSGKMEQKYRLIKLE